MPYLPETLESIAAQTYPRHQILAWDNGSTDGTVETLQKFIPSRIPGQVITGNPMRLGASLAALVEMADTELCARIDGDDVNLPTRLQEQVAFLTANPQVGVLGSLAEFIDEVGGHLRPWECASNDPEIRWGSIWKTMFIHPTVMFRRSAVLEAGNYRDLQPAEDYDLWFRMSRVADMASLQTRLIKWRRHAASETTAFTDFYYHVRKVAELNADVLFPDLKGREALALWDASIPTDYDSQATMRHGGELKRAAEQLAVACRKPMDYFTSTEIFKSQTWFIRRRCLNGLGLGLLLQMRDRLALRRNAS